jgi:signal transduction histidine kinase
MAAEVDQRRWRKAGTERFSLRSALRRFGGGFTVIGGSPPDPGVARVRFDRETVIDSDPAARRLLGSAARSGAPTAGLIDAAAALDARLGDALDRLSSRGEAFRLEARFPDGRAQQVAGSPWGGGCSLTLTDVTDHVAALERARAEADAAHAEIGALRAALDASGAAAWRLDGVETTAWRSQAAGRSGAPEAALSPARYDLPDGGAVIVSRAPAEAPSASPAALGRFVETVTETFAHLRIGLAIFDHERRLTIANPAVAEIFGMGPELLAGRPTLRQTIDRLREARQLPEQLDYPAWRAALFTLFDDPRSAKYDERWELPDGRSIHVVGRPHPSGGIAFVFEDVTEAINAQRWRLTAVEARRAMLDALVDGVIAFGPDGKTRLANPALAQIWRLGDPESAPRHVSEFSEACRSMIADIPIWDIVRDAVSGATDDRERRWRVRLTDGRVLQARIAQMPDGSTLAAFSDVTDSENVADALRERTATLEAAEKMRAAMLYQISHGLRTPLNAVIGFADLLAEGHVGPMPTPQASYLDNIRAASTAMLEGVESLSELVGSGGAPSVAEKMDEIALGPILRGAIELLEQRAAEKRVEFVVRQNAESAACRGDPPRVRQMIYAALAEAMAYAVPASVLTIDAAASDGALAIWCEGADLPDAESPAFAVARRTAEMHSGRLRIERLPDGGSRVVCLLPAGP